jgi:acyl-CoA hydrolase
VVTEHGVASLAGKSADERAEALIAIADPAFRAELEDAWKGSRHGP